MASLNKVFLIGNLTRDPELRYSPTGTPITSFGMAINRIYTAQSGERKEETCFVRVVVFGRQAETCSQYLSKGRLVCIEGRLQYRSWEVEGQKRNALDVIADRVQFLGRLKTEEAVEASTFEKDEEHIDLLLDDKEGETKSSKGVDKEPKEEIPF